MVRHEAQQVKVRVSATFAGLKIHYALSPNLSFSARSRRGEDPFAGMPSYCYSAG
jgi:hypothetical protein